MGFKPSPILTVVLAVLAGLFLWLGNWQLQRQQEKQALFERFENAPTLSLDAALHGSTAEQVRFARVQAQGRYDEVRHILLDNRIEKGRAGVEVFTPFHADNGQTLLVNRGWLPLAADRRSLPAVPTGNDRVQIRGILNQPPQSGPQLGEADQLVADQWPQLMTYPNLQQVEAALSLSLEPWVIQLDAADPTGFGERAWQPAVMPPRMHGGYAVQWFGFALTALVIWIILGVRRAR